MDVYTVRNRQFLCDICGGDYDEQGNCNNSRSWKTEDCRSVTPFEAWGEGLVKEFTRWVLHHELGHSLNLTAYTTLYGTDHAPYIASQIMTDEP